jgi:hypothetical protein
MEVIEFPAIKTYYFSGYVTEDGSPVDREVVLYRHDTKEIVGTTTSDEITGYFEIGTSHSGTHSIFCLDDVSGADYNDLIFGDMTPSRVE